MEQVQNNSNQFYTLKRIYLGKIHKEDKTTLDRLKKEIKLCFYIAKKPIV